MFTTVAAEDAARAADSAFTFGAGYTLDILANLDGGLDQGTAILGKIDASVEIDGSTFGISGARGFVALEFVHGRALSEDLVGDAQVTSNIEAASALRPLEAWVELPLARGSVAMKLGLIDLNSEFDVQRTGALFLNSSHGIGPDFSQSGLNGPSIFPTTAGAIILRARTGGWSGRLGLFDAVAGDPGRPRRTRIGYPGQTGLLAVAEVERGLGDHGAVKLGAWSYSTRFPALAEWDSSGAPVRLSGNRGLYASLDARLAEHRSRALDGWIRFGIANPRINAIGSTIGGGLAWGHDSSRLGIAVSRARLGSGGRNAAFAEGHRPRTAETNIEMTYSHAISPAIAIQPDVQYVIDPSWRSDLADALVVGVRTTIAWP